MLPDNLELQTPQKKEWPLIPADVYQTEITAIDYRVEPNRYKTLATDPDEKQVMNFEFTIIEEGPHYGRKVWQKMAPIKPYPPQSKGKPTWVYRLATAMEGHPITKDEADRFGSSQINDYFHCQVRVNITESPARDNGKQYNNIEAFLTIKEKLPKFDPDKVPKENQPADATVTSTTSASEPEVSADIAEMAGSMEASGEAVNKCAVCGSDGASANDGLHDCIPF